MLGVEFIRDLAVVMVIAGAVGWVCQRVGLSLVVGYLGAGAIIGPYTPPFQLVASPERVQMLSQLGLVFLIFSIGLDLGLQRLRRLGLSVVLATVVSAVLVYHGCRFLGLLVGWSPTESLFAAGMLMVSSSAIISKVLQELNATHQRAGQLALGMTVLEDVVAVVMLTVLSTVVQLGGPPAPGLTTTLGALSAFVVALVLVSLLLVPRLLLRLTRAGGVEVRTVVVSGLLLSLAWLAVRAGYSLALGAFLLGVIVASTPQKPEIERAFEGIRDMFGAVFFVSMGMLVDFHLLVKAWPLVVGMTVFALGVRPLAAALGLTLVGNSVGDSVRAGLALTPVGEFSFIIAQLGVMSGAVPETFYPMAVGASLLTTVLAPWLMRRAPGLGERAEQRLPLFLREWVSFYHAWLGRLAQRQQRSVLWRLTGRRIGQTAVGILFVSALLLLAHPVYGRLRDWRGEDWLFPHGLTVLFWSGFGMVVLAPLVAIWRNLEALAMIFAESATQRAQRASTLRPLLERVLKTLATGLLVVWLLALVPLGFSVLWAAAVVLALLTGLTLVFWRRLVRWHSRLEIELQTQLKAALGPSAGVNVVEALRARQADWQLQVEEFTVPDFVACAGRTIGELALRQRFGASIVSIDRQGYLIRNPGREVGLYPRDKLLLVGAAEQLDRTTQELSTAPAEALSQEIEELSSEIVQVPPNSPHAGKTLLVLDLVRQLGVQVAGIQRGKQRVLTPSGADRIEGGDELLVLGTPKQIREFRDWLATTLSAE